LVSTIRRPVKLTGNSEVFRLHRKRDRNKEKEDTQVLNDRGKALYLSGVMSLMFLSRLTRYDMLFWNSYLATRSKAPTREDFHELCKLMKYLESSGNWGIRYKYGVKACIREWCDSAHSLYLDGRGQMGLGMSLGSGFVLAKSNIIRMITLSSTESEFFCMCEGTTYIIWMRSFMENLGFSANKRPKPRMYEDNNSAMWWSREDMTFARTKHLMIKKNFVKEAVEAGIMDVMSCDTREMPADMLTKPMQSNTAARHMIMMGMEQIDE
jgi:hypothetical protein